MLKFKKPFEKYACPGDKIVAVDGPWSAIATIYRDDCSDAPDREDEGFWPSKDETAAGYVLPEKFDEQQAMAERVMAAWKNDEWFYVGVAVVVSYKGIALTGQYENALWRVECNYPDSDNAYLMEVANELAKEALETAKDVRAQLCKD